MKTPLEILKEHREYARSNRKDYDDQVFNAEEVLKGIRQRQEENEAHIVELSVAIAKLEA